MIKLVNTFKGLIVDKIYKGYVIVRSQRVSLDCLDLESSESIWGENAPAKNEDPKMHHYVTFAYENWLYVSYGGLKKLIDLYTGEEMKGLPEGIILGKAYKHHALYANENDSSIYGVYDLNDKKSLWEKRADKRPSVGASVFGKYIIYRKDWKQLICYNFNNGELIWQTNIEEISELKEQYGDWDKAWKIDQIIALSNDKLYLSINRFAYAILDANTGQFLQLIKQLPASDYWETYKGKRFYEIPVTDRSRILEKKKVIIGFNGYYYWELNTITDKLSFWNLRDYFISELVYSTQYFEVYEERILFFLSDGYTPVPRYVTSPDSPNRFYLVAFDIEKKQIIHKYSLDGLGSNTFRTTIVLQEKWIRISDNNKNTYIFEITDSLNVEKI